MKPIARFIRSATPVPLRKAIRDTGDFFGFGLAKPVAAPRVDASQFPSVEGSLEILKKRGLRPGFCVDVGAYHGEWTQMFKAAFPEARILMAEAQESKRAFLEKVVAEYAGEVSLEIGLLGPEDGREVQFNEMETGSSVFAETSHYPRKTTKKVTRRLDSLLAEGKYPAVDFLKLDVQGYELEILKGAPETLRQATAVLMEASFVPINSGCPLVGEVVAHMNGQGFRLFDFCSQARRHDGVLWQTDLLFVKESSAILPEAALTRDNWG